MIYFIQSGKNGAIKIGYTTTKYSADMRIGTMQTGSPAILTLLKLIEGDLGDERALHLMFDSFKINKEWFEPDISLLEFIKNPDIKTSSRQFKCICKRCGHDWGPKKSNPKSCPKCKRYDWNEDKKK